MGLTIVTPAVSVDLTTLAVVKDELGIENTSKDVRLARLITGESQALSEQCGRVFARQVYQETVASAGGHRLQLSQYPIPADPTRITITQDGVAVTDFVVDSPAYGVLWRDAEWDTTEGVRSGLPFAAWVRPGLTADYTVGYPGGDLLPGDDRATNTLSFTAATKTIADSAANLPLLVPGDTFVIAGSASNNGRYTVVSRTAAAVVVSQTLVNESAGATVTLTCRTLPVGGLERLCIRLVRAAYHEVGRDPALISDRVGDRALGYARPTRAAGLFGGLVSEAELSPYRSIV